MLRSQMLQILAQRLSNRDVEDIEESALLEIEYVQKSILEKLPNQPWFLETELLEPLPSGEVSITLPDDYNGLVTHGGVWIVPATLTPLPE